MIDINLIRTNPELVKANIKRKFQDRKLELVDKVIELDAESRKVKAEADEFHHLREMVEWLQQQLYNKEERFAEQTKLVRDLQRSLMESEKKVVMLETERSMKLCERRGCLTREPQSGY